MVGSIEEYNSFRKERQLKTKKGHAYLDDEMRAPFFNQEFGTVPSQNVIISIVLFCITYPLAACKSLSSNNGNTTVSDTLSLNSQERLFMRKLKDIVNLKARANVFKDCNTTKVKILAEIIKRYKEILRKMSKKGARKPTRMKMKDLVREQKNVWAFTTSTNQRKRQISFKNGRLLSLNASGKVYGSHVTPRNVNNTIFYVKTKAPQVVVIQSLHNKKYVAMDKHGRITSKSSPDQDTLFYLRTEETNFLTLASYKYYLLCPFDMFLAIRNNGCMRSPHQSVPGQDSTQMIFVPVT